MEWLADPQAWIALVTLIVLEIVLGIDNIIFIVILADQLPEGQQGNIYFAMAFSAFVEMINMRVRGNRKKSAT